jgi:hypothetical protein
MTKDDSVERFVGEEEGRAFFRSFALIAAAGCP